MEVQGLTNQAEYERIRALTKVNSPDAAKKIAGFLNKVQINFSLTHHSLHIMIFTNFNCYCYFLIKKKEIFLSPGHDRVVTIKSRNFSIAKVWCCLGLY